ncbi:MAG: MerR family transcriptional regulator [Saprospiraceae bacterium]
MTKYSVKQLSELAGVSIRTLHHYDKIGLLVPYHRSESNYRYYGRKELFRLQQILFYKELGFPLKEITEIMNDPAFDLIKALEFHKNELHKKIERTHQLLATIEKTISELNNLSRIHLGNKKNKMTEKEIYAGFSEKEINSIKKEVTEKWNAQELKDVEERIQKLGKEGWADHQQKGEEINQLLADLMDWPPSDIRVQKAIVLHHQHLNFYYEVSKERYLGLAKMYIEDDRFYSFYNKYRKDLAAFLHGAITVYCENGMQVI